MNIIFLNLIVITFACVIYFTENVIAGGYGGYGTGAAISSASAQASASASSYASSGSTNIGGNGGFNHGELFGGLNSGEHQIGLGRPGSNGGLGIHKHVSVDIGGANDEGPGNGQGGKFFSIKKSFSFGVPENKAFDSIFGSGAINNYNRNQGNTGYESGSYGIGAYNSDVPLVGGGSGGFIGKIAIGAGFDDKRIANNKQSTCTSAYGCSGSTSVPSNSHVAGNSGGGFDVSKNIYLSNAFSGSNTRAFAGASSNARSKTNTNIGSGLYSSSAPKIGQGQDSTVFVKDEYSPVFGPSSAPKIGQGQGSTVFVKDEYSPVFGPSSASKVVQGHGSTVFVKDEYRPVFGPSKDVLKVNGGGNLYTGSNREAVHGTIGNGQNYDTFVNDYSSGSPNIQTGYNHGISAAKASSNAFSSSKTFGTAESGITGYGQDGISGGFNIDQSQGSACSNGGECNHGSGNYGRGNLRKPSTSRCDGGCGNRENDNAGLPNFSDNLATGKYGHSMAFATASASASASASSRSGSYGR